MLGRKSLKLKAIAVAVIFLVACAPIELKFSCNNSDQQFEQDLLDCFDQVYSFGQYYGVPCKWKGCGELGKVAACMKSKGYESQVVE